MLPWQLRRPLHHSWLIAIVCLGIVTGLCLSSIFYVQFTSFTWLVSAGVLLFVSFRKGSVYVLPIVLLAGVAIGLLRGNLYQHQLEPYAEMIGQTVTIEGKISDDSDIGSRGEIILRLKDIVVNEHSIGGAIWLSVSKDATIKRGDRVEVKGELSEGFGSFAASMYRAELLRAERPVPGDVALRVRDWFAGGIRQAIPEPEASLGVGYLVGQRRSLPEELDKALQAAGLTHVVVASGYNLTILVNVARRLFAKVSKFLATFFSGGMIIAFISVTGMSPSMSRAGLVAGLGLLAWYYGRRFHPVILLTFAAAVTLLIQPAYARGDLGWQLSFASFAGVLIVAPLLQNYFFGTKSPGIMRQVFFETVSAWLCTVPLILLVFGQFSNVAILANLLVLPLVPLAMLLTFIAGSAVLFVPAMAIIAGIPASLLLGYMTNVTMYLGNLSWAQTSLEINPYLVVIYYGLLLAICGFIWKTTNYNFIAQVRNNEALRNNDVEGMLK